MTTVLVTGALGNLGQAVLDELTARGYQLRALERPNPTTRARARRYPHVSFIWGDIADPATVHAAVPGVDVIVHLAFVIPRLSATGRSSEEDPTWARRANLGGTQALIAAAQEQPKPPRFLFTSSLHVYGRTMHMPPPRRVNELPSPIEHYARHKVLAERLVRTSGLTWSIFRLAAALPVRLITDPGMFDVPLDNRIEFIHRRDVALAVANALETEAAWGRIWHIGGGPENQLIYRDMVRAIMETIGVGMLPEAAFSPIPYPTDWLDTTESQAVLAYQTRTFARDYLAELNHAVKKWRPFIRVARPFVRAYLLRQSPYLARGQVCHWAWGGSQA
ncbi:MAG: NAD(P)-dependent oxidoreductase [Chloroflexi bacterium]|nr:NAD(P)-dependent oxidoreductase [Chloroflexota bacterium]